MPDAYLKLGIAALLPVITAAVLYLLEHRTAFGKCPRLLRQIIFGVIFGGLAIVGTEWGIPLNGAQVNCRDAAVLIGGLLFGAPAGIIAGLIGGIERWIAVAWGVGRFTRVACTVSTIIAGFYAAALRKWMFEDKRPGWAISLAAGIVMEVLHLMMVFLTNMSSPNAAIAVVTACTIPMLTANGLSVMFASILLTVLAREKLGFERAHIRISQTVQRWLLVTVAVVFALTSVFIFRFQNQLAADNTDRLLALACEETAADIRDASDQHLLSIAYSAADELADDSLLVIMQRHSLSEVSVIDRTGHISASTNPDFVGFDMHTGPQSEEFLCLLDEETAYVQSYGSISYDPSLMRKYAGVRIDDGFIQVGYDAARFQSEIDKQVVDSTRNRHVGETGCVLILDADLSVVSKPRGMTTLQLDYDASSDLRPGVTYTGAVNGDECSFRYISSEGYYIVSVLPVAESMRTRDIAIYINTFLEVLVFAVLFALIYLLINRTVVNQISSINTSLSKITDGDLDETVSVRSNAEFALLSDDINSTVGTLKRYIAEASERIATELELAKNIQASSLPSTFPAFPKYRNFDIYASMDPAKEVGGDFYDFYITRGNTLNFLVADVSGKGIPAALFMMRAKTELKHRTEADLPFKEVFEQANNALVQGNDAAMFVTAWQGGIDLASGRMQCSNAGHNPPLVRHAGGRFEYLKQRSGLVLGVMENARYKPFELELVPGDVVFLYTDGVTEATNADGQLYGDARLLSTINNSGFDSMKELCSIIKADVNSFVGDAPQFDDITMVAFHYLGAQPEPPEAAEEV